MRSWKSLKKTCWGYWSCKCDKNLQNKNRSRLRWISSKSPVGFDERNKERSSGILGKGGAVGQVSATSLHNDALLDSEEYYEWEIDCADAHDESLMRSSEDVGSDKKKKIIVLSRTSRTFAMEELSDWCGKSWWRWRSSKIRQKKNQGVLVLVLDVEKVFEQVSLPVVCPWATHFNFPRKILQVLCWYCEHQRRVISSKDVWLSRCRLSRSFSQVEVELLTSTYCVAGRIEWGRKNLHASKIEGFWWMTSQFSWKVRN